VTYLLVLQFPGRSLEDFDELVSLEAALEKALGAAGSVDGHDFGSGEGNLFIQTSDPAAAFRAAKGALPASLLGDLKAAYREKEGESYTPLWPPDLRDFKVV
jgi:hypothetical protein